MSVDFYQAVCQEPPTRTLKFGICDDENGAKAYTNSTDNLKWVARVENPHGIEIIFTAIDNCISILKPSGDQQSRCDGMLTYLDNIVFVELKNQRKGWIQDGIGQIEATINVFKALHNLDAIKHKRAFVANKKHPLFHTIEIETKQRFYHLHKVRLNLQAKISI